MTLTAGTLLQAFVHQSVAPVPGRLATDENAGLSNLLMVTETSRECRGFCGLPMCEAVCYLTARWRAMRPPRTRKRSQAANPLARAMAETPSAPG